MLPHSRVELRRWFDSHKVGDCVVERGSEPPRDPLEAVVAPLVIRPSMQKSARPHRGRWGGRTEEASHLRSLTALAQTLDLKKRRREAPPPRPTLDACPDPISEV